MTERNRRALAAVVAVLVGAAVLIGYVVWEQNDRRQQCQALMDNNANTPAWGKAYAALGCGEFLKRGEIK